MKITVRGLWIKGQTFTCISLQRFGTHLHMCFKYIKHVLLSSLRQNSQVKIRCEAGSKVFNRNAFILKLSPKPPQSTMANSQDISRFLGKHCWTPWECALSNSQSQNQIALHSFSNSVCLSIWMSGGRVTVIKSQHYTKTNVKLEMGGTVKFESKIWEAVWLPVSAHRSYVLIL